MAEIDNKDRTRYYGIRVGDTVRFTSWKKDGKVTSYDPSDNNCVFVEFGGKKPRPFVAEWLTITKRVEDDSTETSNCVGTSSLTDNKKGRQSDW